MTSENDGIGSTKTSLLMFESTHDHVQYSILSLLTTFDLNIQI